MKQNALTLNTIHCGDCLDWLPTLPDNSVDLIATDPPYGHGLFEWDKPPDVPGLGAEFARIVTPAGFVAVFGTMPYMFDWHAGLVTSGWDFLEHVAWIKRNSTPLCRLSRSHESILIYGRKGRKFYQMKGPYEDVKFPGILVDAYTVGSLQRYVAALHARLNGKSHNLTRISRARISREFSNAYGSNGRKFSAHRTTMSATATGARTVSYSNVWSFLPPGAAKRKQHHHPTQKPLEIMRRLVTMLTPAETPTLVCDPFCGSGTTCVAAAIEGRRYLGCELNPEYVAIAENRIKAKCSLPLFDKTDNDT